MNRPYRPEKNSTIERAVKAVAFVQNHRSWTIDDLSAELGIHKNNGRKYLIALSLQMPIVELKPARYGSG